MQAAATQSPECHVHLPGPVYDDLQTAAKEKGGRQGPGRLQAAPGGKDGGMSAKRIITKEVDLLSLCKLTLERFDGNRRSWAKAVCRRLRQAIASPRGDNLLEACKYALEQYDLNNTYWARKICKRLRDAVEKAEAV
jgi:hypothetical protein